MAELFGFSLDKGNQKKKKQQGLISPVAPNNDDGTVTISAGGYYGQYVDMEGVSRNEFEQIRSIAKSHYTLKLTPQLMK